MLRKDTIWVCKSFKIRLQIIMIYRNLIPIDVYILSLAMPMYISLMCMSVQNVHYRQWHT